MYFVVGLLLVVGSAMAAPATTPAPAPVIPLEKLQPTVIPILSQSDETEANGTYKFSYETGNGIKREESSYDKVLPKGRSHSGSEESDDSDEIHVQQGSYSYTAPDGTLISVRYIADENGFQPIGNHIPTVPPALRVSGSNSAEKSGRALKSSDSATASSAVAPKAPVLLSKSESVEESGAEKGASTSTGAPTSLYKSAKQTPITEAIEQPSTTEAALESKEVTTSTPQSEESTKFTEDEKTNTTETVVTTEGEVSKEAVQTEASENEATTKAVNENESTENLTEATHLASTTSESSTEVTTTAS